MISLLILFTEYSSQSYALRESSDVFKKEMSDGLD